MQLRVLGWLGAALAFAYAPHALYLPVWVSGALLTAIVLRIVLGRRLPGWLLAPLVVAGLGAVLIEFRTINGYEAGTSLLAVMAALKLLEADSRRDGGILACLAYFLATGILLVSQEMGTAFYVLATVVLITTSLAVLASPNTPGWQLQARKAATISLQALPIMLVLFLLFPRIPGPLWGLGEQDGSDGTAETGLSDTMEPGNVAELALSREVAFRVQFEEETPAPARRYWRGPVLWAFDGRRWERGERASTESPSADFIGLPVDYTLTLQPHGQRWVLALDLPAATPPDVSANEGFELEHRSRIESSRRFSMRSVLDYRLEETLPDARRERALALPEQGAQEARALAADWRESAADPETIVETALTWFRDAGFTYTLTPQRLERDPVDQFLFETQEGFCESFASAFAVLMRAADIPARVVLGYQGGESGLGDYLIVRQAHAHAWVEVWLPERGWVRIDPTATAAPERIELGLDDGTADDGGGGLFGGGLFGGGLGVRYQFDMLWDSIHFNWDQFVLGYGPELQARLLALMGLEGLRKQALGIIAIGASLAVLLLVWLPGRARSTTETDPVIRSRQRLERKLAAIGLPRHPGEGMRDYIRRTIDARPDLSDALGPILQAYLEIRYQPASDANRGGALVTELQRRVRRFRPRHTAAG